MRGIGRLFRGQKHTRGRGRAAEREAARWLRRQGFEVVERNATNKAGEIDLVALEGDTLCFVEIKARSGSSHGSALAAVDPHKQQRLARTAALYLATHVDRWGSEPVCRFDVVAMDQEEGEWLFTLVRDAFSVA